VKSGSFNLLTYINDMATPVADPLTAVDPQADLGFAAGVTITQSGSRVQNADGSEV